MKTLLHALAYRLWQVGQQLGFVAPLTVEEHEEVARWLPSSALPLFQSMSAADQRHSLRVCRGLQARGCQDEDMLAAALLHDIGKAGGRVPFWTRPVIVLGKMCAPRLLARAALDPRIYGDVILGADNEFTPAKSGSICDSCHSERSEESLARWTQILRCAQNDTARTTRIADVGHETSLSAPSPQKRYHLIPTHFIRSIVMRWRLSLGYAWFHAEIGAELAAEAGLSERTALYIRTHHQPHGPAAELHIVDEAS
jgi:hypothetical protein